MGSFSDVYARDLECPVCGHRDDYYVQFKFGACQCERFEVGDTIETEHLLYGERGHHLVVVSAVGDACSGCGGPYHLDNMGPDWFEVYIEDDVITLVTWNNGRFDLSRSGSFVVLDDYPPGREPTAQGARSVAAKNNPSG
ncbi:hypothetical protein ABZX92_05260 [Lentzea sp. NPDC006480]|uniref:hypothetical protein n=1 Tax=Lentzea sp. NPDC006480 TaxID=3157176 RepID=UPI0033AD9040